MTDAHAIPLCLILKNYMKKRIENIALVTIIHLIIFGLPILAKSQTTFGEEFWFAYTESGPNGNDQFSIYISSKNAGIAYLTSKVGDLNIQIQYLPNSVTEITLPDSIYYPKEYGVITDFGINLKTSTKVNAYTAHLQTFQSEATILYPIEIVGTDYLITTASQSSHTYIIVATKDDTDISIINNNEVQNIKLNEGETFQVFSNLDLSGTGIHATDKIAIFSGCRISKMCGSDGGNNHLFEQLLPINLLGNKYVVVPFAEQGPALLKVLAKENNTEVFLDQQLLVELNSNESFEFNFEEASIIESNEDIQLSQIACHFDSIGDPSLLHLISTDKTFYNAHVPSIVEFGSTPNKFPIRYLNLFAKTDSINDIRIDNEIVDSKFQQVQSNPNYSYAQIPITGNSSHIQAPNGINGYSYGFGNLDAYTYSIGYESKTSTSIVEEEKEPKCSLYPNPFSERIYFTCNDVFEVQIIDKLGRIVKNVNYEEFKTQNISNLPEGIFVVKLKRNVRNKTIIEVHKLVKN